MAIMWLMAGIYFMANTTMAGIYLTAIINNKQQQWAKQTYSLLAMTPT